MLEEIPAPRSFVGRSLGEIDVRARTGVHVLLLRGGRPPDGGGGLRVPRADDRIEAGDRLVVAGPTGAVNRLERI